MTAAAAPPLGTFEKRAWIGLLVLASALRLFQLGTHAFHHDESIHAFAAMRLLKEGAYVYDPVYHGPVQYFAVAAVFAVASVLGRVVGTVAGVAPLKVWDGTSDFTARLAPALAGIALVALAFLLRRRLGARAALATGALCALSPNLLYYTRFCRDDVWSLLGTAGLFLWLDEFLATRRLRDICLASLSAAVAFSSKENFYVLLALMVPSVLVACAEPGRGLDPWNRLRRAIDFLEENGAAVFGALLLFFVVSELLYTVFLVHPESGNPAFSAISYWWGQHKMERVGGPKTFYLPRFLQYEFAILLPALAYVVARWRKLSFAERFLAGWGVSSLGMYAYLGEKAGWLIVHQLLPFLPLAGAAWALLPEKGRALRLAGAAVALVSVVTALVLSFVYPVLTPNSRKAESTIQVQTCPEMLPLVRDILRAGDRGEVPAAIVSGEAGWPLSWYVRWAPVNWSPPDGNLHPPIVVCDEADADHQAQVLGPGYTRDRLPFRAWWIPDTSVSPLRPSPKELVRYLLTRETWERGDGNNPIGAVWVTVFRRQVPAGAPPGGAAPPPAVPPAETPKETP